MVVQDNSAPTYQEHVIDGSQPYFEFQKFDTKVCSDYCLAYYTHEVTTLGGSTHSELSASVTIRRENPYTLTDKVYLSSSLQSTEAKYDFKIKVVGYNNAVEWLNYPFTSPATGNTTMTLRVYCGPLSTTLSEGTYTLQYVESHDYNLAAPTRYLLPTYSTSIASCFITTLTVLDSNSISSAK
jgi:hypothetical protein